MKVFLLPEKPCYKANLHCHSTISDGKFTPAELKELYREKGYQILAYTDHEVLVLHKELNDPDFLTIPGYEVQVYGDMELPKSLRRVCHMNFYPKDPENNVMPFSNTEDIMRLDVKPDLTEAVYEGDGNQRKEYSVKGLNTLIEKARAKDFIVSYNHPTWSKESSDIYKNLKGIFAMEIYNNDAQLSGHDCYCPYVYEEMLRSGQRIGCIATDDTHRREDLFGGFTYIYADSLSHSAVINALEKGDYYASRGPVIRKLRYENGVFHIECSAVKEIIVSNQGRRNPAISIQRSEKCDITTAEFPVCELDRFVRFTITDAEGKTANTRAYWRDEFEKSE